MRRNKIIEEIENSQMNDIPEFSPGDTVSVQVLVKEGTRERLQAFEGVVIGIKQRGLNSAFIVRKISHGVGVERTFQTHCPLMSDPYQHKTPCRHRSQQSPAQHRLHWPDRTPQPTHRSFPA